VSKKYSYILEWYNNLDVGSQITFYFNQKYELHLELSEQKWKMVFQLKTPNWFKTLSINKTNVQLTAIHINPSVVYTIEEISPLLNSFVDLHFIMISKTLKKNLYFTHDPDAYMIVVHVSNAFSGALHRKLTKLTCVMYRRIKHCWQ